MNRLRLNVFLAVVVVALAVGAWMAQRHKAAKAEPTPLTTLAPEAVTHIRIEWPGKPAIALEKQAGGAWLLAEPVRWRADRFEAVGATSLVGNSVTQALDSEGLNLKEIGLDPPDHVVQFNDTRVEFGGTEPLQQQRYVRVGNQVSLIEDPNLATLDADPSDLIDKDLFAPGAALQSIQLKNLSLVRNADGAWSAPPGAANATPDALKTLAEAWSSARALYNESAPGDAPKGDAVTITLKDGSTQQYVVVATDPQLVLYAPALKVRQVLSKELVNKLFTLPAPKPAPAPAAPGAVPLPKPEATPAQ